MSNLPEVRFQYAWLLSDAASVHLSEKWGDGTPLESFDYYANIANKYSKWWEPDGDEILDNLCKITGLEFKQNTIDVYVAPWFYAFSVPMVLGVIFKDKDTIIRVLTHEIIHRLLTDNTVYEYDFNHLEVWGDMFGKEHSNLTLSHIPVHAIFKKLFVDIMNRPDLVKIDIEHASKNPAYAAAWDYVEKHGHDEVIAKLRSDIDKRK